ncbi:RNA polymerase sigma factor [Oceanidesulfovibrio marinus]|uniref:Uncharacterized protein n=1 Tax=Oceanidesulfovibrio marinus TaxID=370038 RepID=A0A6P1ZAG9_9BACT|nr:hypothetical protein [Oceanidesulfovibrio marinus]TVM30542.1 hypothetical protein DQK91_20780 [Oceanidesulfovibrio marinus]
MTRDPVEDALSKDEICSAIEGLSDEEWCRLNKGSSALARFSSLSPEDLIQEAIVRALDGRRKYKRDLQMIVFLMGIMKSIVSSEAKASERHKEISLQVYNPGTQEEYQAGIADERATPERETIARLDLAKIKSEIPFLFVEDSEEVQLFVMGVVEGMTKEEVQRISGLYGNEYDSARRLFRRRIEKAFPGGW